MKPLLMYFETVPDTFSCHALLIIDNISKYKLEIGTDGEPLEQSFSSSPPRKHRRKLNLRTAEVYNRDPYRYSSPKWACPR